MTQRPVGLVLGSEIAPEHAPSIAAEAEQAGFGEVWMSEDYFFAGGVSGAAAVLAATRDIPVGIGVASAVTRHPALLAMELATLARVYPGRLMPAIGLGVPGWLQQMGLDPKSRLGAVRECLRIVRSLLDGEQVKSTEVFHCDDVQLAYPPARRLPLRTGVVGPKMLQVSGEHADGTLLSVLAGPDYVRWARQQIAVGADRAGRDPHRHAITTFALCAVDEDSAAAKAAARSAVAFYLGAGGPNALTDAYGVSDELRAMIEAGGLPEVQQKMPDQWVEDLAVAGDPDECVQKIAALLDAGSDSVALFPTPPDQVSATTALLARDVLPRLAAG